MGSEEVPPAIIATTAPNPIKAQESGVGTVSVRRVRRAGTVMAATRKAAEAPTAPKTEGVRPPSTQPALSVCASWVATMLAKATVRACGRPGHGQRQREGGQGGHGRRRAAPQDIVAQRRVQGGRAFAGQRRQVPVLGPLQGDRQRGQGVGDEVDGQDLPRRQRRGQAQHGSRRRPGPVRPGCRPAAGPGRGACCARSRVPPPGPPPGWRSRRRPAPRRRPDARLPCRPAPSPRRRRPGAGRGRR